VHELEERMKDMVMGLGELDRERPRSRAMSCWEGPILEP